MVELNMWTCTLAVCGLITALITLKARSSSSSSGSRSLEFKRFQYTYLAIYYISMTADWLQVHEGKITEPLRFLE